MNSHRDRGGIFISYRREETAANAGRLYDRLSDRFGEHNVFMDIDSIALGADFTEAIREAVSGCNILLALIGRNWLGITDSTGRRRLDNPDDFVRVEIETALQRSIRVVPILVDGAELPQAQDLPQGLQPLILRQALQLTYTGFRSQVESLLETVAGVLEGEPGRGEPRATQSAGGQYREQYQDPAKTRPAPHAPPPRIVRVGLWVETVAFSLDGARLATTTAFPGRLVRIWDLQTGAAVCKLRPGGAVVALAFSPDGTRLATGSNDNTARIWDTATGDQRLLLTHGRTVNAVAFSPDGTRLATGSNDKHLRIWDIADA